MRRAGLRLRAAALCGIWSAMPKVVKISLQCPSLEIAAQHTARARARYRDPGGRARPSGRRSSFLVSIPRAARSAARLIVANSRRLGLRQAWAGPGQLGRGSVESQQGMPAGARRAELQPALLGNSEE